MRHWESYASSASQFSPYSALKGYEELIAETARLKSERHFLGEDAAAELDAVLRGLREGQPVEAVYYDRDDYRSCTGVLRRIDGTERCLWIEKRRIELADLLEIRELTP